MLADCSWAIIVSTAPDSLPFANSSCNIILVQNVNFKCAYFLSAITLSMIIKSISHKKPGPSHAAAQRWPNLVPQGPPSVLFASASALSPWFFSPNTPLHECTLFCNILASYNMSRCRVKLYRQWWTEKSSTRGWWGCFSDLGKFISKAVTA